MNNLVIDGFNDYEGNEIGAVQTPKLIVRVPLQEGWRTDFKQIDSQGETVESNE